MSLDIKNIDMVSEVNGERLDAWLSGKLEHYSRSYIQKLIDEKCILVNEKYAKSNYKLKFGDIIHLNIPEPQVLDVKPEELELEIMFEDEHIAVVNKPQGMVVHPATGNHSGTLVNALMAHCGDSLSDINGVIRPGIVHRIDKDTSGVLVIAKTNLAHEKLSELLKDHDIKRVYNAVVKGIIREETGKIDMPIGRHPVERKKMAVNTKNGRKAITYFKVLERFKNTTFVELQLETGRTHQIRVHMSNIGFPIVGDPIYGGKSNNYDLVGQALHARVLGFVHPVTSEYMEFEAPLPAYFKSLLEKQKNSL